MNIVLYLKNMLLLLILLTITHITYKKRFFLRWYLSYHWTYLLFYHDKNNSFFLIMNAFVSIKLESKSWKVPDAIYLCCKFCLWSTTYFNIAVTVSIKKIYYSVLVNKLYVQTIYQKVFLDYWLLTTSRGLY